MLGSRFNLIALLLEGANLMTSRMLPLSLMKNPHGMVRMGTMSKMKHEDEKRNKRSEALTIRDEVKFLSREEESRVFRPKAELKAAGETPLPRIE